MSYLGLRTWDLVRSGKSQLSGSQRLRLHGLTSSDLGLIIRTWTLCEPALRRKTKKIVVHFAVDFEASAAASLRKICTLQHLARGGGTPGMIVKVEDRFC